MSTDQPSLRERQTIHAIHLLFGGDEHLLQFLFHHKRPVLREPASELLEEARAFTREEYLLVQVALDLFSGSGWTQLRDLIAALDDEVFLRVLQAITYHREMVEAWEALSCCE